MSSGETDSAPGNGLSSCPHSSHTEIEPSDPQMGHLFGQTHRKASLKKLLDKDLRSFVKVV